MLNNAMAVRNTKAAWKHALAALMLAVGIWNAGSLKSELQAQEKAPKLTEEIDRLVGQIAKGEQQERSAIVSQILDARGFAHRVIPFEKNGKSGKNIEVELQGSDLPADKWIILGAHLDRVAKGQGAVDNGAGCITLLTLMERLKQKPLENLRITACFFDLEENGLWGSEAYSEALTEKPRLYINFDVFAYGKEVWLHSESEKEPFVEASQRIDADHPLTFEYGKNYPPSDHLSFRKAGIRAVSFSLLPPVEVDELERMFGGDRTVVPTILRLIHTPDDLPAKVVSSDMESGIDYVEKSIRLWAAEGAKVEAGAGG